MTMMKHYKEQYYFTSCGRVWNDYRGKFMKARYQASLSLEDGKEFVKIGRVVWELFNDVKLTANDMVWHKDGNKYNNSLDNLQLIKVRQREINPAKGYWMENVETGEVTYLNSYEEGSRIGLSKSSMYKLSVGIADVRKGWRLLSQP